MLAFIRDYIGRWGGSPSISEIAQGTNSGRDTVKKALRYLEADGLIIRRPGARGIVLPDRLADALRELRAAGFIVDEDVVRSPFPPLPPVPEHDYDPG